MNDSDCVTPKDADASPDASVSTPTLDLMVAVHPESQAIGNFIAWLEENGMHIAVYYNRSQTCPINESIEQLLARYFDIDLNVAEKERCAILAAFNARTRAASALTDEAKAE